MKPRFVAVLFLLLVSVPMVGADYTDPDLEISKGTVPGHWKIHKFGHNEALSTNLETIWSGSNIYTYPPAATIMNLTSTDVDDNMGGSGAWGVTVYGLDGNYDMINETMQLNGQNPIPTTLKYLRVYRVFTRQAGATGYNEGIIYLGTGATIGGVPVNKYAIIDQNYGQTMMTQFTIPNGYTGYLKHFTITCFTANKNFESYLRIRWIGESWRRMEESNTIAGSGLTVPYEPPLPIIAKTDIEFIGKMDVAGGVTEINYDLILVKDGYSLITDATQNVNIVESIDLMSAEFVVFTMVAALLTYLGSTNKTPGDRMLRFGVAFLFWIGSLSVWISDGGGFVPLLVLIAPTLMSLVWTVQALGETTDHPTKKDIYSVY